MNTTNSSETSNDHKTNDHDQTITQQHTITYQHDLVQDPNDTTQPRQERQCTPGHRDPMVRAAGPDGRAAKIQRRHDVDLAMTAGRPLADGPVVRSC